MVQKPHPSGRVVSMRLLDDVIERLDALCARTHRSRGDVPADGGGGDAAVAGVRSLGAAVPVDYERHTFEREFIQITSQLMDSDGDATD